MCYLRSFVDGKTTGPNSANLEKAISAMRAKGLRKEPIPHLTELVFLIGYKYTMAFWTDIHSKETHPLCVVVVADRKGTKYLETRCASPIVEEQGLLEKHGWLFKVYRSARHGIFNDIRILLTYHSVRGYWSRPFEVFIPEYASMHKRSWTHFPNIDEWTRQWFLEVTYLCYYLVDDNPSIESVLFHHLLPKFITAGYKEGCKKAFYKDVMSVVMTRTGIIALEPPLYNVNLWESHDKA